MFVSLLLTSGCSFKFTSPPPLWRVKNVLQYDKTKTDYLKGMRTPPNNRTIDAEGNETLEWIVRIRRNRETTTFERERESARGDIPDSYTGYYTRCLFRATFDPEGNKISHEFIGDGAFNSKGELYDESTWWPDTD